MVRIYDLRALRASSGARLSRPLKHLGPPDLSRAVNPWSSSKGNISGLSFRGKEIVASFLGDAIYLFDVDEDLDVKTAKPVMSGLGPAGIKELRQSKGKEKLGSSNTTHKKRKRRTSSAAADMNSAEAADEEFGPPEPDDFPDPDEGIFYQRRFTGHCSIRTVKECNFFGPRSEYVVSGSDCGHIFIWDTSSAEIVTVVKGDASVVNSIHGHPHDGFVLASSGIESDIKIWQPGDPPKKLGSFIFGSRCDLNLSARCRGDCGGERKEHLSVLEQWRKRSHGFAKLLAESQCFGRCARQRL